MKLTPMPSLSRLNRASLLALLLTSGCANEPALIPPPLDVANSRATPASNAEGIRERTTTIDENTPKPPSVDRTQSGAPATSAPAPREAETATITLSFDQLPLPSFIQAVYGTILKKNFSLDPAIASRNDLITLRTSQPQTPGQVSETARMLLKTYGVAVTDIGGLLRIVPDNTMQGYAPEIRRGRALPETPLPLRPIFQLVELQAVRNSEVAGWIRTMFGTKINLQEDSTRNAVLLSGQSDDVISALEAIHVLDQPLMKGRQSLRINPVFWSADELAKKLTEVLQAEGYSAGTTTAVNFPVSLLPIQGINAIIVFAGDKSILDHVTRWAQELDKASTNRGSAFFTYQARNIDAQDLAKTMQDLLTGATTTTPAPAAAGTTPAPARKPSRVVVNNSTNTLIFQGNPDDYTQLLGLLQELDKPAKAALIEVTVAEVTLNDSTQLGVEWALSQARVGGALLDASTLGGLGIGSKGLNVMRLSNQGDTRLVLNALANNSQANILSSPRVLARNGEAATIQVGQEVPIITSQQTNPTTGGTGGVLQSVQYRTTGVILKVKPIIHAGDRIDLEVSQEVSSAQATTTGVSSSPTISTRKVETKLSLRDGSTILLGGLISGSRTRSDAGVPLLKDIPVMGQLFRTNNDSDLKTELLVLITPYVVSDDHDALAITEAFRKRLGPWARTPETLPAATPTREQ